MLLDDVNRLTATGRYDRIARLATLPLEEENVRLKRLMADL